MAQPIVSIVLTTYNSQATLPLVLDAIIKQTYPLDRVELIIVDGGSKDKTIDKIEEFLEKHGKTFYSTKSIIHDKNYGVSRARNDGIKSSHGDYILILDADVVLPPKALDYLINAANIVLNNCRIFKTLDISTHASWFERIKYELLKDRVTKSFSIADGTLIPRELPNRIGFYNEILGPPYTNYEDLEYGARAWRAGYKISILGYLTSQHYSYEHDMNDMNVKLVKGSRFIGFIKHLISYLKPNYGYVVLRFITSLPAKYKIMWLSYSFESSLLLTILIFAFISIDLVIIFSHFFLIIFLIHYVLILNEYWNDRHLAKLLLFCIIVSLSRIIRSTSSILYTIRKIIRELSFARE